MEFEFKNNFVMGAEETLKVMNGLFHLSERKEEYVYVLAYNSEFKLIGIFEVCNEISSKEIFIRLALCGAVSFVVAKNHLGENLEPESKEINEASELSKAAELCGFEFIDYIIMGDEYFSLKRNGLI